MEKGSEHQTILSKLWESLPGHNGDRIHRGGGGGGGWRLETKMIFIIITLIYLNSKFEPQDKSISIKNQGFKVNKHVCFRRTYLHINTFQFIVSLPVRLGLRRGNIFWWNTVVM